MKENSKQIIRLSLLALSVASLIGCSSFSSPPEFSAPSAEIPEQWALGNQLSDSIEPWWHKFSDDKLNQLIEQVLQSNSDLALATLTLQKAKLQAGISATDQYPQLSASTSASRSRVLTSGSSSSSYSANLSVSYELDLWGRVSSEIDAAQWSALASQQDRESTAQSLVATTASLYWQIGYLNDYLALSSHSIDYARQTLTLTEKQYQSGAVSQLNVLEAKRSLAGQEASHSQLIQQKIEATNALSLLLNQAPKNSLEMINTLPETALPEVVSGIPADILARRPDVKAALYNLRSAISTEQATTSAYFPTLSLTGSVGDSSAQLSHLLADPVGTLGASLTLPFLQWNEFKLNKKISHIDAESAVITYRQTLYSAFEDVNNALSARQQYLYQGVKLQEQYLAAQEAERIYASQYRHGAISIQDWLDAQETLRSAEESLLENRYNQYNIQATLYQALGGPDVAPQID